MNKETWVTAEHVVHHLGAAKDLENGWNPKYHDHPAREGKWIVLKLGAVSFRTFNVAENKESPATLKPRPE